MLSFRPNLTQSVRSMWDLPAADDIPVTMERYTANMALGMLLRLDLSTRANDLLKRADQRSA